ncbi:MAG: hypothetical protein QOI99_2140, partial [Actinomycetota bacterium]|nr:hypothetical protein [Actinomycetota bacterium]
IEGDGPGVRVRLRSGPEPALQLVENRLVACHLHGVTDADAVVRMART